MKLNTNFEHIAVAFIKLSAYQQRWQLLIVFETPGIQNDNLEALTTFLHAVCSNKTGIYLQIKDIKFK